MKLVLAHSAKTFIIIIVVVVIITIININNIINNNINVILLGVSFNYV